MNKKLVSSLQDNLNSITSLIPANSNLVKREIVVKGEVKCLILYISVLVKQELIEENIISRLLFNLNIDISAVSNPSKYIMERCISSSDVELSDDLNSISFALNHGSCVILTGDDSTAIVCKTFGGLQRKVSPSDVEKNIYGGKEAFIESLQGNLSLIRQKLRNKNLQVDSYVMGEDNGADVALIYLSDVIDKQLLNDIQDKLSNIKAPAILATGYLKQLLTDYPGSLFPLSKRTEKPDTVITDLLQGKAAILINTSPYALIVPTVFIEFFQSIDDYNSNPWVGTFERFIRLAAIALILMLAPIYVVLLKYNSELIPLDLIKQIMASRMGIPLPPVMEVLIMELLVEFLREGGLRLPTPVGQNLGIVGGIILGEAATRAGLVSPTTLVVVAIGIISTFVIPSYEMSLSIRLLRFPLVILAQMLGLVGLIVGMFVIIVHLIKLDSFGIPYFSPISPLKFKDLKDTFVKPHASNMMKNPVTFKRKTDRGGSSEN